MGRRLLEGEGAFDIATLLLRLTALVLALAHGWEKIHSLALGEDPRVMPMIVGMGLPYRGCSRGSQGSPSSGEGSSWPRGSSRG